MIFSFLSPTFRYFLRLTPSAGKLLDRVRPIGRHPTLHVRHGIKPNAMRVTSMLKTRLASKPEFPSVRIRLNNAQPTQMSVMVAVLEGRGQLVVAWHVKQAREK